MQPHTRRKQQARRAAS